MPRSNFPLGLLVILLALMGVTTMQAAPARQATLPPEAVGVEWALVSLQPSGAAVEDTTGLGITLNLNADGSANGSGGCNNFNGGYTVGDAQALSFGPIASTLRLCEGEASPRETRYFQALEAVSSYSLVDGQLRLKSGDSGELVFASGGATAPTAPAAPAPPAQLPSTGGDTLAPLLLALLGALALGLGLRMRRAA